MKVELDRIFGFDNMRAEIVWERATAHHDTKGFRRVHDTVFGYSKGKQFTFNKQYAPYAQSYIESHYNQIDEHGRRYQLDNLTAAEPRPGTESDYEWKGHRPPVGGHWRYSKANMERLDKEGRIHYTKTGRPRYIRYLDEMPGVPLGDVWTDISPVNSQSLRRLGYPTQKPVPLMERIIGASSNEGDLILDAFCGCGKLEAAAKLGRRWIGVDVSPTACRVMGERLEGIGLREGEHFEIIDLPKSEEELRKMPHFEFQNWAVIALGGIPSRSMSGDFGVDGRLYPADVEKRSDKRAKKDQGDFLESLDKWYPIQVKQKDKAGRPDIDSFETAMMRDRRTKGYFVAFGFSKEAMTEIKRAGKDHGLDILPVTVAELVAELLEFERKVGG